MRLQTLVLEEEDVKRPTFVVCVRAVTQLVCLDKHNCLSYGVTMHWKVTYVAAVGEDIRAIVTSETWV